MIPKITQERPNILPRYWCGTCGNKLPPPEGPQTDGHSTPWKFCPICGEAIEYDKTDPVQWTERDCDHCGRSLIRKPTAASFPSYFTATSDYVGTSLCRGCMEEHCVQTNCLQCGIGRWPDCPYDYIKQQGLQKRSAEGGTNGETS